MPASVVVSPGQLAKLAEYECEVVVTETGTPMDGVVEAMVMLDRLRPGHLDLVLEYDGTPISEIEVGGD